MPCNKAAPQGCTSCTASLAQKDRSHGGLTKVVAVVVTYHPELTRLACQLSALLSQVDGVVVVDNHSSVDVPHWLAEHFRKSIASLRLGSNQGIARAQNIGIAWARENQATHILLMDQDSVPSDGMVSALLQAERVVQNAAALGPCYFDPRQRNPPPFIRVNGLRLERLRRSAGLDVVKVDYLIASGCLIPMAALGRAGLMREDFFIDYVDIEWGLRAQHHGLQSYGVFEATMHHSLGDEPQRFFGRSIPVHAPLRHYYHVRNAVLLYRERWVPWNWKLVDGWRLLLKFGYYSLMTRPRQEHFRMMLKGFWHGATGRSGSLHEASLEKK